MFNLDKKVSMILLPALTVVYVMKHLVNASVSRVTMVKTAMNNTHCSCKYRLRPIINKRNNCCCMISIIMQNILIDYILLSHVPNLRRQKSFIGDLTMPIVVWLVLLLFLGITNGITLSGTVNSVAYVQYLGSFCFDIETSTYCDVCLCLQNMFYVGVLVDGPGENTFGKVYGSATGHFPGLSILVTRSISFMNSMNGCENLVRTDATRC